MMAGQQNKPGAEVKKPEAEVKHSGETMEIVFTRSPTGAFGLAYNAGDKAKFPATQAKELIEAGFASLPE